MDLDIIPPDLYSAVFEGVAGLSALPIAVFLIIGLIGGMGNNALTAPAQMSSQLWDPFRPFIDHYLQIHGIG